LNLLEATKSHGVKQFLYASSIAVYGKRASPVMDEETICRPELWRGGPGPGYAITKLTLERLCLSYHVDSGLPVTVFRIDVVFDAVGWKSKIQFAESELSGPVIANVVKAQKLLQWKPLMGRKHLEEAIVRMIQKETSRLHH